MNKNVYLDIGNQLIKIGYYDKENCFQVKRISSKKIDLTELDKILNEINFKKIYIGSVVKNASKILEMHFKKQHYEYEFITNELFKEQIKLEKSIHLDEVGTDILGFCYYIKNKSKTLAINFGTATVAIYYDKMLNGVTIGTDFFNSYEDLLKILSSEIPLEAINKFGTNTNDAVNASKYFLINGFINEILKNYQNLNEIIFTGGSRRIFYLYKNITNIKITEIDEAVLLGYKQLIEDKHTK